MSMSGLGWLGSARLNEEIPQGIATMFEQLGWISPVKLPKEMAIGSRASGPSRVHRWKRKTVSYMQIGRSNSICLGFCLTPTWGIPTPTYLGHTNLVTTSHPEITPKVNDSSTMEEQVEWWAVLQLFIASFIIPTRWNPTQKSNPETQKAWKYTIQR